MPTTPKFIHSILILTLFLSLLAAPQANGANGSQLVGVSPVSRGMGGTAVGGTQSILESLYKNPANLSAVNFGENTFAAEAGASLVGFKTTADIGNGAQSQSSNTLSPILGFGHSNGDFRFALGVFGYAGTNVDYSGNAAVIGIKAAYKVTRFALGASYQLSPSLSMGIEPFVTYSTLQVNTSTPANSQDPHSGLGLGIQAGAVSAITEDLSAGLNVTSPSKVTHQSVTDLEAFYLGADGTVDPVSITTPWDLSLGLNYKLTPDWKVAADYHYLMFSTASGYLDYDWQSVSVFALGTSYQLDSLALRAGFNFNLSPINNTSGETGTVSVQGHTIAKSAQSLLDIAAFPGFGQAHLTVGAGYEICKDLAIDFAFLFAPKVTRSRAGTNLLTQAYTYTGTAQQWAASLGVRYQM